MNVRSRFNRSYLWVWIWAMFKRRPTNALEKESQTAARIALIWTTLGLVQLLDNLLAWNLFGPYKKGLWVLTLAGYVVLFRWARSIYFREEVAAKVEPSIE